MPDEEKCHSVSLYVFYLLSVHKDPRFVTACFEFLKFRRFKISAEEILPVLVNYGASLDVLCYSSFQLPHQFRRNGQKEATESFPIFNMDMVRFFFIFDALCKDHGKEMPRKFKGVNPNKYLPRILNIIMVSILLLKVADLIFQMRLDASNHKLAAAP